MAVAAALGQLACSQPPGSPDAGGDIPPELACATLVNATCGASLECGADLACEAARYLAQQDPVGDRCLAALNDGQRYPSCAGVRAQLSDGLDDCAVLIDEVCGALDGRGARACAEAPACVNAVLLASPTLPDAGEFAVDEQRLARCAAAIDEKGLYPPCRP